MNQNCRFKHFPVHGLCTNLFVNEAHCLHITQTCTWTCVQRFCITILSLIPALDLYTRSKEGNSVLFSLEVPDFQEGFQNWLKPGEGLQRTHLKPLLTKAHFPLSRHFRYPKLPQTWWRTARHTYARTPSSCPSPPLRTLSGRRSSSAPSSDDPLVELYRCRHGVAWLLCLHHTWSYWP